ncbi:hypothetical protein Ddye_007169 [Dipteronia dyeriana]|uniref:Uncharacterized protein n=1 Tax=Dipteronia dyeriana TaxID=168575 RepID=A0AAD9XJZ9_9ROSI|nr:hypothetical protein Ddye_007169 [Dipteronia dyeriana]
MAATNASFFVLLSLISNAFTSMHGLNHDPLIIEQVVSSNDHDDLLMMTAEHQFSAFKKEYGKTYPTQEEDDYRFGVFISNLRLARRNQIRDPTAIHGVTKFSDLTSSEFRNQYLLLDQNIQLPKNLKTAEILPTDSLPETYDWRDHDAVTPVKDQGSCSSCWAFTAIATLETAHFMANDKLVELSEQQLVDCSHECEKGLCNKGCTGGNYEIAYVHMKIVGGIEKATDYRYTGKDDSCKFDEKKIEASLGDAQLIKSDEDQFAANLVAYTTIAVLLNGEMMKTYQGEVSCPDDCPDNLNHAVTLVGYGSDRHWIIKNSWGKDYGEDGYYRICRGKLTCSKDPSAVVVFAD